ncbi:MAG: hypothetical protein RJQ14_06665 [Marinoscillum sp.]
MKRIILTAAVIVTVMSAALASGNGAKKQRAAIIPGENVTYKVLYENNEPMVVRVKIKDENGVIVRADKFKSEKGFMQRYDLNKLEEGTYFVELRDKYGVISEQIKITKESKYLNSVARN